MWSLGTRGRRLVGVSLMAVAAAGAECGGQDFRSPFDPDGTARLQLSPDSLMMELGETSRVSARLGGSFIAGATATWSTADPLVATVDGEGNVTCVGTGEVLITAVLPDSEREDDPRDSVLVTCVAPARIRLDEDAISDHHVVGESPCPDPVGEVTITNPTAGALTVQVTSDNPAIVSDLDRIELGPGESVTMTLFFDCSVRSTVTAAVTVSATDALGNAHFETVFVEVSVAS